MRRMTPGVAFGVEIGPLSLCERVRVRARALEVVSCPMVLPTAPSPPASLPLGKGRRGRPGFTLVEMLLTLAIITVISAMAWPVLQRPLANQRLHSAADEVRTRLCKTRIQAMRSGHVYAFRYQLGGDHFRTEPEVAPVPTSSLAGIQSETSDASEDEFRMAGEDAAELEDMALPQGVTFLAEESSDDGMPASLAAAETGPTVDSGDWSEPILFYPDGTASNVQLVLGNDQSGAVRLLLRGITGTVTVADVDPNVE